MTRPVFALPATDQPEPIEYQLGDVVYRCVDDLPAEAIYLLNTSTAVVGTIAFIRGCLDEVAAARFDEQMHDRRRGHIVTEEVLAQVLKYLVRRYSARPTLRPGNSPGGPQATTDSSPLASASPALVP